MPLKSLFERMKFLMLVPAIIAIYYFIFGIYRAENPDDAWTISFFYNFLHKHIVNDPLFGAPHGGVQYFGIIQAYIYGPFLDAFGWTRDNIYLISSALILASMLIWVFILKKLRFPLETIGGLVCIFLMLETTLSTAFRSRPEALLLLSSSIALLFTTYNRYFWAGLFCMLSFEIYPIGVISFAYVAAGFLHQYLKNENRKKYLLSSSAFMMAGVVLGIAIYLGLHHQYLCTIVSTISKASNASFVNNSVIAYFFETQYLRHIPELLLIVLSIVLYFLKKMYLGGNLFTIIFLSITAIFAAIFPRENYQYVVLYFPAFTLMFVDLATRLKKSILLYSFFLILLLPQYAIIYHKNHDSNLPSFLRAISSAIPNDKLPVVGTANSWFAFKDRTFYSHFQPEYFAKLPLDSFYFITNTSTSDSGPGMDYVRKNFEQRTLSDFSYCHEHFVISQCSKRHTPAVISQPSIINKPKGEQ